VAGNNPPSEKEDRITVASWDVAPAGIKNEPTNLFILPVEHEAPWSRRDTCSLVLKGTKKHGVFTRLGLLRLHSDMKFDIIANALKMFDAEDTENGWIGEERWGRKYAITLV
jgi:hypothetical protein